MHAQVVETHAARCDDASGAAAPSGAGGRRVGRRRRRWTERGRPGQRGAGGQGPSGGGAGGQGAGGAAGVGGDGSGCVALVVHMADGPRAGRDLVQLVPVEPSTPRFAVGDPVVLSWSGGDADDPGSYQVVDFQRSGSLWWLAGLFAAAVLALGRWRGLAALAALGLSFVVLLMFVLPAILAGHNPLWVAVVGACLIMFVVLYLTHGPSARTSTAVLGTLVSLLLIGGLSAAFTALARLTGLDDTTSALIGALGTGVDARGLLLAGVVIGALGVLDDVTVTQTSAVWELHGANPALGARGLFSRRHADRPRPRLLGGQHPRAGLRGRLAAADADLQRVRARPRRRGDHAGGRHRGRPHAGGQHRAGRLRADHDGGGGRRGEPGGGPAVSLTPPDQARLPVRLAVDEHVERPEGRLQLARPRPATAPALRRPRTTP